MLHITRETTQVGGIVAGVCLCTGDGTGNGASGECAVAHAYEAADILGPAVNSHVLGRGVLNLRGLLELTHGTADTVLGGIDGRILDSAAGDYAALLGH